MKNDLIQTLKSIMDLTLEALDQAKREDKKSRLLQAQFRLLEGDMGRKKKLPPGIREYRPGQYEGRRMVGGKQLYAYGRTPEEVQEKLSGKVQQAREAAKNRLLSPEATAPLTFGDWWAEYMRVYKVKLKPTSARNLWQCFNKYVPEAHKAKPLTELTPGEIDEALLAVPFERQRQIAFTVYHGSLMKAYKLGHISDNVAARLEPISHEYEQGVPLTLDEQAQFLRDITGDELEPLFLTYLYSGCRPSEALTLKPEYIDRERGELYIDGTKNKAAKRYIPLFPELLAALERARPVGGYIFGGVSLHTVQRAIKQYLPKHTPKDLRHTFATRCRECGIDDKVIAKWMGHKKVSTTQNIYQHVQNEYEQRQAAKYTLHPNCPQGKTPEKP